MKENQANRPIKGDVTLDLRTESSRAFEPWAPLVKKILWTASQLHANGSWITRIQVL